MNAARIISVNSRGTIQVQHGGRVIAAQVMTGGVHIGGLVDGPMEAGIQTWLCSDRRVIVVDVQPCSIPAVDPYAVRRMTQSPVPAPLAGIAAIG